MILHVLCSEACRNKLKFEAKSSDRFHINGHVIRIGVMPGEHIASVLKRREMDVGKETLQLFLKVKIHLNSSMAQNPWSQPIKLGHPSVRKSRRNRFSNRARHHLNF